MSNPYQPQQPPTQGPGGPPRQGPPPGPPGQQQLGPAGQPPRKPKSRLIPALITGVTCALVFGSCGVGVASLGSGVQAAAPGPTTMVTVTAAAAPAGETTVTVTEKPEPAPTVTVTEKPKPGPTVTVTKTEKAKAPTAPSGFGPGTYEVGVDMPAGKYKTKGPDDSGLDSCYWSRNRDASGEDIIANSLLKGQGVVVINKGEYFETDGCQDWVKQ